MSDSRERPPPELLQRMDARGDEPFTAAELADGTEFERGTVADALDWLADTGAVGTRELPEGERIWWSRGDGVRAEVVSVVDHDEPETTRLDAAPSPADADRERLLRQHRQLADLATRINVTDDLDEIIQLVTDEARELVGAHQSVTSRTVNQNWEQSINAVSLSEKYAEYRDYDTPPDGSGIYALVCERNDPMRMTQAELESHPAWEAFGEAADDHPPMDGWLAVPVRNSDGENVGLIQLSDKYEGEFTEADEAILIQLAHVAAAAIQNARLYDELRASEQRYRTLFESMTEGYCVVARGDATAASEAGPAGGPRSAYAPHELEPDASTADSKDEPAGADEAEREDGPGDFWYVEANPTIEHHTGLEDIVGERVVDAAPGDPERWATVFEEVVETGEIVEIQIELEPEERVLRCQAFPVGDCADGQVGVTVQNITERVERERRLEESNERLEQFAHAASHDLQEPLRMVSTYLQLIEDRYAEEFDEDGREYFGYAVDGADRMREMIDALLSFSRVETEGAPLEPVDLGDVVDAVLTDLSRKVDEHDAEVVVHDLPRVRGDASQLQQVLQNLIENAVDYAGDEPPLVEVAAERHDDQYWCVSVADEGIGIDPEHQEAIFQVFQRLHSHEEHAGTGIGLALCERIVERHGGEIWVESKPGEGSTFSFTLATADAD